MFTFNTKKKTVNAVLKEIDDRIEELKKDKDDAWLKLEGYARAKDEYDVKFQLREIERIDAKISELGLFRIGVEYM